MFNILIYNHIILTKLLIAITFISLTSKYKKKNKLFIIKFIYIIVISFFYFNF